MKITSRYIYNSSSIKIKSEKKTIDTHTHTFFIGTMFNQAVVVAHALGKAR